MLPDGVAPPVSDDCILGATRGRQSVTALQPVSIGSDGSFAHSPMEPSYSIKFSYPTLAVWDRGGRASSDTLKDDAKLTVYFRNSALSAVARGGNGLLPAGGIARFYGTAKIHMEGEAYEQVWNNMVQQEHDADPEKKGFAVLIRVERAEDLRGQPLPESLAVPKG